MTRCGKKHVWGWHWKKEKETRGGMEDRTHSFPLYSRFGRRGGEAQKREKEDGGSTHLTFLPLQPPLEGEEEKRGRKKGTVFFESPCTFIVEKGELLPGGGCGIVPDFTRIRDGFGASPAACREGGRRGENKEGGEERGTISD